VVLGAELRTWKDNSGVFSVEAEFVKFANGTVRLRRVDGRIVDVPLLRLSKEDITYVRSYRGTRPARSAPRDGGDEVEPDPVPAEHSAESELTRPTTYEFADTPLTDVAAFLAQRHNLQFWIDRRALEDIGIATDSPLSGHSAGRKLGDSLTTLLKTVHLTWFIEGGAVVVTTPEVAEQNLQTRVYRLLRRILPDDLAIDVTHNIDPNSWIDVGGTCSIEQTSLGAVVITQTYHGHAQIRRHYANLLKPIDVPLPKPPPVGQRLASPRDALLQPTVCEFIETPLTDVVDFFKDLHKIEIQIDTRALEGVGIGSDSPITMNLKNISLESALTLMLRDLDLTWTVLDNALMITTPEAEESQLTLVGYPVKGLNAVRDFNELIVIIRSSVNMMSWNSAGGPGSIRAGVRGTLDVRQSFHVHRKIERVLAALQMFRA
jgi:hypothetical protein